ncbi:MAG: hypothetical protein ACJ741_11575 [Pyrinomonadaceae bacterium]
MYLIQLLLPVYDNEKNPFGREAFDLVREELAHEFGGVTAFMSAPAEGVWREGTGGVSRDDVVVFEVMCEQLERAWWTRYRAQLEERFRQDLIVARSCEIQRL